MKITKVKIWLAGTLLISSSLWGADMQPGKQSVAVIQNQCVKIAYNLETGTFDLVALPSGQSVISSAHSEIGQWESCATNFSRTAKTTRVKDELGDAKRLVVKCTRPASPTIIAEFIVHGETNSFVTLRLGLENHTAEPIRIKDFYPVAGGVVYPGVEWKNIRSLNGDSACADMKVIATQFRRSANNLLLTFQQTGQRRSLVMGALKTEDFTKWVQTMPEGSRDDRSEALNHAVTGVRLAGYLNSDETKSSVISRNPEISIHRGEAYAFEQQPAIGRFATVLFDAKEVMLDVAGLDPAKRYAVGFSWWDYDANGRVESVVAGGSGQQHVLLEKHLLPAWAGKHQPPEERAAEIPSDCYATGNCQLRFINETNVPNAVVSEVWVWEVTGAAALPSYWTDGHPVSQPARIPEETGSPVAACLQATDPLGRLVDAGTTYLPDDSFYVDGGTPDPFDALERYGKCLALATHAEPHIYDFPTVCAWYAGVWHTRGAQNHPEKSTYRINTTAGLVEEMDCVRTSGFSRYSRAAGRLVPDTYAAINPQGWWDDEHWQKGGYYVAPYETSQKYGRGMHERDGLAFIYIQPTYYGGRAKSRISQDFREQHTKWLCGQDVERTLDYTNPGAQEHLRKVFAAMRGGIDGMMVDYCDDLWNLEASKGGFYDPHTTSVSFYRTFFKFAKDGLGPNSWLHERNLNKPDNDLTLGFTDLQRTSDDTDKISPEMVSRSGLRWYKNRVVLNYDMDSKDLNNSWKVDGFTGSDSDGRRMMLTMAAISASRLLIANSFRDLSPAVLHDLSRVFPYYSERRSARPLDAFTHDGNPRIYDFPVNPDWHQLVLYNNALPTKETDFSVPLSGDLVEGAPGLSPREDYYVYDFWNNHFVGRLKGSEALNQTLRPGEARMLSLHKVEPNPQFISTSRHILQGYVDMAQKPAWNARRHTLSGASKIIGGETYEIIIALNGFQAVNTFAHHGTIHLEPYPGNENLAVLKIDSTENATIEWQLIFK